MTRRFVVRTVDPTLPRDGTDFMTLRCVYARSRVGLFEQFTETVLSRTENPRYRVVVLTLVATKYLSLSVGLRTFNTLVTPEARR